MDEGATNPLFRGGARPNSPSALRQILQESQPSAPDIELAMTNDSRLRVLAQSASARWDRRKGRVCDEDDLRRLARQKEIRRRKYQPTLRASPMMRAGTWDQSKQRRQIRSDEEDEDGDMLGDSFVSRDLRRAATNPQRFSVSDLPFSSEHSSDDFATSHFRFNRPPLLHRHSVQADGEIQLPIGRAAKAEQDQKAAGKSPDKAEKIKRYMDKARRRDGDDDNAETDWILNRELQERLRKLQRTMAKLRISIPEDDGSEMIANRLDEVRSMCKQVIRAEYFFSLLPKSQQELVLKLEETSPADFKKERRKNWKKIDMFRFAGRMAHIISKASYSRRRYMQSGKNGGSSVPSQVSKQKELNKSTSHHKENKDYALCSISKELRNSLITRPEFRTSKDIKQIIWLLRATKAFTHLFPAEMEETCALYVGYEKYDDGRVLAYQDKAPEKFYFVIGGKINRIRQYKLTLGEVNKSLGFITKAMTTDPEEMENEVLRDSFLVAKGLVECLVLQKWAYFHLLKSTSGPPLDFLRRIDIFQEFPCELFLHNLDAIDMRYFGPNKMVVRDSNRTPWLHIVKSGLVKVVRYQNVYDNLRNRPVVINNAHKIGEGRRASHAVAMMGLGSRQRQMKESTFSSLPEIPSQLTLSNSSLGLKRSRTMLPVLSKRFKDKNGVTELPQIDSESERTDEEHPEINIISEQTDGSQNENQPSVENGNGLDSGRSLQSHSFQGNGSLLLSEGLSVPSGKKNIEFQENEQEKTRKTSSEIKILASRPKISSAPNTFQNDLKIPMKHEEFGDRDFIQRTFLTRERTELSAVLSGKKRQTTFERATYVQLDTLRPGDVFGFKNIEKYRPREKGDSGLDHLGAPLASEDVGLTLISEGAEIIRISKRFFVANAENNTMLKVETLYKDYMNEDSAKELLRDQNTWHDYKSVLIHRTITTHSRRLKTQKSV